MLDSKLQNYIIQIYDHIDEILSSQEVTEGYLSQNHILTTKKNKWFLKKYRESYTKDEVADVHKVIRFFSDNNIPVIPPIKNKRNSTYFIFNSEIYTLFPFINAITGDRKRMDNKSIKSLAKSLAKIHLLSSDHPPLEVSRHQGSVDREGFINTYPKIMKALTSTRKKDDFDRLALRVLKFKKSIVDKSERRIENFEIITDHLLHGDYHKENVFFDNNGEVQYIFDCEKAKMGNRLHELIRSMDYICLNGEYGEENIDKARLYLQTYKELYPFEREAFLNALEGYYLKKAHSLWIERTHYLHGSDRVDCFLENELALLKCLSKNYKSFAKRIGV